MNKIIIKPYNIVDHTELPELSVNQIPVDGDPLEINKELYYVCQKHTENQTDTRKIGVIPLIVRNPAGVNNIKEYIRCLSIAHRRVHFRNANGMCDLENCEEMIID
jgi:hypothetical protein